MPLDRFDKALMIYQAVNVAKTRKLTQGLLQQAYHQNVELTVLNQQAAAANEMQKLMLRNQAAELWQKERQRILKDLTFTLHLLVKTFESVRTMEERIYFMMSYSEGLEGNLQFCISELVELQDKMFAQSSKDKLVRLKSEAFDQREMFFKSPLFHLDSAFEDLIQQKASAEKIKERKLINFPAYQPPSVWFGSGKQRKLEYDEQYNKQIEEVKKRNREIDEEAREEYEHAQKRIMLHDYFHYSAEVQKFYPDFDRTRETLIDIDSKIETIIGTKSLSNNTSSADLKGNRLLKRAAILIVKARFASIAVIKSPLRLNDQQANTIMHQLEQIGVVKSFSGKRERELLVHSIDDVEKLFS